MPLSRYYQANKYKSVIHYMRSIYLRSKYKSEAPIIARHACLGADVLQILKPNSDIINIQKGRVDYLRECWENSKIKAKTGKVIKHIERHEIIDCVLKEEIFYDWINPKKPVALFMDSMAELADQRFEHQLQKWSFLSSYSDLSHTEKFKNEFLSMGLLSIPSFDKQFDLFFNKLRIAYGDFPIFYLHFPIKLESRQKFRDRGIAIKEVVDKLALKHQNLFSISVEEEFIDWDELRTPEMWNFAYHYNRDTYKRFAELILSTGKWPE